MKSLSEWLIDRVFDLLEYKWVKWSIRKFINFLDLIGVIGK